MRYQITIKWKWTPPTATNLCNLCIWRGAMDAAMKRRLWPASIFRNDALKMCDGDRFMNIPFGAFLLVQLLFAHNSIWIDANCEMWMSFQNTDCRVEARTGGNEWRKLYFQNVWQLFRNSFSFHYLMLAFPGARPPDRQIDSCKNMQYIRDSILFKWKNPFAIRISDIAILASGTAGPWFYLSLNGFETTGEWWHKPTSHRRAFQSFGHAERTEGGRSSQRINT